MSTSSDQIKIDKLMEALKPFVQDADRIVKDYGADRPMWQLQCLMIPMGDLLRARAVFAECKIENGS
jgi:hypothetical protein